MIPRIIHYCWFGGGPMPDLVLQCIQSWHDLMPDWEFVLWDEDNFDVSSFQYTREAYDACKYAFVSDVARLYALKCFGGVYLDTDVLVYRSFDPLLKQKAFVGFEGSKHCPVGTCVIGSEKNGEWVCNQLNDYMSRPFVLRNGDFDLTTNVYYITKKMKEEGFIANGNEQDFGDIHIYPVDYFCPRHTTGEYIRTENTFCEHLGIGSWTDSPSGWKSCLLSRVSPSLRVLIIKMKRKILG